MNEFCENCKTHLKGNAEFCNECGIPVYLSEDNDYFVCPVCEAKLPPGEKKCNYCCSMF